MNFSVENRFKAVEKVVKSANERGLDEEVASYFCKLGSVLVCGAIERSIEVLVHERICSRSAPQVTPFIKHYFKRGTNYTCDEILSLLSRFDNNWGREFEVYLSQNERIKSSVNSCYSIRNSVAHGGSLSLGPVILRQYFDDAFTMVCKIEDVIRM